MRGKSAKLSPFWLVHTGIRNYEDGFHKIDPFAHYQEYFSHYADLKEWDDGRFDTIAGGLFFAKDINKKIPSISSCGDNGRLYIFHNKMSKSYTKINEKTIFIGISEVINIPEIIGNPYSAYRRKVSDAVMHEVGHAFCTIFDEYQYDIYPPLRIKIKYLFKTGRNCVIFPDWGEYGNKDIKGCFIFHDYFKPSIKSIMNTLNFDYRFNIVSCGYCLKEIKPETFKSKTLAWDVCMQYDAVKPSS